MRVGQVYEHTCIRQQSIIPFNTEDILDHKRKEEAEGFANEPQLYEVNCFTIMLINCNIPTYHRTNQCLNSVINVI